jgi:thiol-disulfide isomerase/thioredoxin
VWCGDSKRELPRFLKIADEAGFPPARITLYSLDRTKKSPDGMTARYGIEYVPTFIVLKDGAEVGRITESPKVSVEADLLTILAAARAQ